MKYELSLADYWSVVKKKRRMIIGLTLAIVIITAIASLVCPKTYESQGVVELGKIGIKLEIGIAEAGKFDSSFIFEPEEAKNILKSSVVLVPVIEEFFTKKDMMTLEKFNEKFMEVEIITEQISLRETRVTPYISIKVKADKADKSKEIVSAVIGRFFDYTKEEFSKQKGLIEKEYNKSRENIEKELNERKLSIIQFEREISDLQKQIDSISSEGLSTDGISKATLLKALLDSYKGRLSNEKNKKIQLEQYLKDIELDLDKKLANTEESKVISYPQVPLKPSKPKMLLNILVALIIGLFASVLLAFFSEALKSRD